MSVARNFIIKQDDVRSICLPNASFDTSVFEPHIEASELQYIKPFLGKDLYYEIQTQLRTGTLTALNNTLVEIYLKPILAWYTFAKATPFMHVNTKSGGFFVNDSEYSTGASSIQRSEIYNAIIQSADSFLLKAKEYIEENDTDYPLYSNNSNIDNNTNIVGGIILDRNE